MKKSVKQVSKIIDRNEYSYDASIQTAFITENAISNLNVTNVSETQMNEKRISTGTTCRLISDAVENFFFFLLTINNNNNNKGITGENPQEYKHTDY